MLPADYVHAALLHYQSVMLRACIIAELSGTCPFLVWPSDSDGQLFHKARAIAFHAVASACREFDQIFGWTAAAAQL